MGHRVGIDLGTTNSAIAMTELGRQRCIKIDKNEYKSAVFPSAIAVTPGGKMHYGATAKRDVGGVQQFKRDIGTERRHVLAGKPYSALELSAALLGEMRRKFEEDQGPIEGAVITVPANYGEPKRAEVREAGRLAGLEVLRIINEPSAAAIAYARSDEPPGENTLVIDWGGGTLDVSLMDCVGDVLDIKANEGDEECGGMDIDRALRGVLLSRFASELSAFANDPKVLKELADRAEEIKIHLSDEHEWAGLVNVNTCRRWLDFTYSRAELDRLVSPLVDRVFNAVERCLQRAPEGALSPSDVTDVILVGGSCHIPLLHRRVESYFGRKGRMSIDPMEVVALGAAYQAEHSENPGGLVTIHSMSTNLGLSCMGKDSLGVVRPDLYDVLLPATTKLPGQKTGEYWTVRDDQDAIEVRVFESLHDTETVEGLTPLATRSFDMPPGPARSFGIKISFTMSVEQRLTILVEVPERGVREEWVPERQARLDADRTSSQARVDEISAASLSALTEFQAKVRARLASEAGGPGLSDLLSELDEALVEGDLPHAREIKRKLAQALFADGISLN